MTRPLDPRPHVLMAGPGGLSGAHRQVYYRAMSQAKSPEDKCAECGHPRNVHHDYGTPHCIPIAEPGQPAVACNCLEFAEPER